MTIAKTKKTMKPKVEENDYLPLDEIQGVVETSKVQSIPGVDEDLDYESVEDDNVRIFTQQKVIATGVEIDTRIFRVYLTEDKRNYLEFREPDTGEVLDMVNINKEKVNKANKKNRSTNDLEDLTLLEFICKLSTGHIKVTISLLKSLPIKYQYRIMRTLEKITEAQGTKLTF